MFCELVSSSCCFVITEMDDGRSPTLVLRRVPARVLGAKYPFSRVVSTVKGLSTIAASSPLALDPLVGEGVDGLDELPLLLADCPLADEAASGTAKSQNIKLIFGWCLLMVE